MREVTALVASVLDEKRLVLNVGSRDGVNTRDKVAIWRNVDVKDPQTGEHLGTVRIDKLRLYVASVDERLCVAQVESTSLFASKILGVEASSRITGSGLSSSGIDIRVGDEASVWVTEEDPPSYADEA